MLRALGAAALRRPALRTATTPVATLRAEEPIAHAIAVMSERGVGSILVAAHSGAVQGILTERDVLEKLDFDASLHSVSIESLMTREMAMQRAQPDSSMGFCLEKMQAGGFRHIPIMDGTSALAMLSMRDVGRVLCLEHATTTQAAEGVAACQPAEETAALAAAAAVTASDLSSSRATRVHVGQLAMPSCIEVPHASTVAEAVVCMREWRAGAVLVPARDGDMSASRDRFSIFTERDYLNMLGSAARLGVSLDPRRVAITACATPSSSVVGVTPNTAAIACLRKMVDDGVRQLPVVAPVAATAGSGDGASASAHADADAANSPRGMLVAVLTMRDVLAHFLPGSG